MKLKHPFFVFLAVFIVSFLQSCTLRESKKIAPNKGAATVRAEKKSHSPSSYSDVLPKDQPTTSIASTQPSDLQAGYALLIQLASQLRRVDQIFILKTASAEVEDAITPVSELFTEVEKELRSWFRNQPALAWNGLVLPAVETETRKSLEKIRTSELLSATGKVFEKRLLASQDEGLAYASALMAQIAATETTTARKTKLREWQKLADAARSTISTLLFAL